MKVFNNNLERALVFMQRQMQSSGIERLIKNEQAYHIKNSEKRVLARKNLERKIRSQDLARKLKSILIKKVRYFYLAYIHNLNLEFNVFSCNLIDWVSLGVILIV